MVEEFNFIKGFKCLKPDGAFYAFPNIKGTGYKSKEFSDKLLYEAGTATLAGSNFGKYGEGYLRVSYANSIENIKKAVAQIKEIL